ncbi:MAG TPA: electron transfer flavoprotein subunit alpha/FixB family protein [Dehalococcoidia bacterium]|nr:electron transfer flavoprotein subunit alpha/FixB family protein [Dehalococcoidia bacterium]
MSGILVLAEHKNGELIGLSTEILGAARRLADQLGEKVVALSLGSGAGEAARKAITYGADSALTVENPALDEYSGDAWVAALLAAHKEVEPSIVLMGQTMVGRDLAPRYAVRAGTGVAMDCIDLSIEGGKLVMTRPVFGGNAHASYTSKTSPAVATVRAKSQEPLEPDPSRSGEVKAISVDVSSRSKVVGREEVKAEGIRLEDAKVVVSGGRGLGGPEGFEQLHQLAEVLGGAVGASRAVVDLGWVPVSLQVGLTGKVVTPDLYIAVGISGASQHVAGITGVKNVVAINKDKDADIFKISRYGAVVDWKPFMAAFLEECKRLKA